MARRTEGEVKRVAAIRYWRATEARVAVDAWRRSGEEVAEFARHDGIHPGRLKRWAGRLDQEAEVAFYPLRIVQGQDDDAGSGEPIEIVLGEGCTVRVPAGFAGDDLQRVLAVLAMEA